MSTRVEGWIEKVLRERPWRNAQQGRRAAGEGLIYLFSEFADFRTSGHAARGLVQGVVLATGEHGRWARRDTQEGRDAREAIIAFLTDIGCESPLKGPEHDEDVRRTARLTLAKHVCPLIARPSDVFGQGPQPENLGTLTRLVAFYGALACEGGLPRDDGGWGHELTGKNLRNVLECLERVYHELREHRREDVPTSPAESREVMLACWELDELLVDRACWDILSRVRAVTAVPLLYAALLRLSSTPEDTSTPVRVAPSLLFNWSDIEHLRHDGILKDRSIAQTLRVVLHHDIVAIMQVTGSSLDPDADQQLLAHHGDVLRGLRQLLLELTATFVREIETACPGVLSDIAPPPEAPARSDPPEMGSATGACDAIIEQLKDMVLRHTRDTRALNTAFHQGDRTNEELQTWSDQLKELRLTAQTQLNTLLELPWGGERARYIAFLRELPEEILTQGAKTMIRADDTAPHETPAG
ncbi:MAG: hypothetical protein Q7S96_05010 [bacterium]|nr:hypothetical protein [bacterium]